MFTRELLDWAIMSALLLWPLGVFSRTGLVFGFFFDIMMGIGIAVGVLNSIALPSVCNLMLITLAVMLLLRLLFVYLEGERRGPHFFGVIGSVIFIAIMTLLLLNVVTIGVDRGMEQTGAAGLVAKLLAYNDEDSFVLTLMGAGGVVGTVLDTILVTVLSHLGYRRACAKAAKKQKQ